MIAPNSDVTRLPILQNKDRLIEVILEELDRIRDDGVTEEELANAKVAYLQASRVRRTNDSALSKELLGTLFTDRTMKYHADHETQIETATVESVNQAIRQLHRARQIGDGDRRRLRGRQGSEGKRINGT